MKATRFFLTSGALALLGLATPMVASAETHVGIGIVLGAQYPGGRYDSRDAFRYGLERGRREGAEHGYRDGRRNRGFDFWRDSDYRDADNGYKRWMGSRGDYASGYRRGYAMGYRQAFASARPGWRDDRYRDDNRYRNDDRYRNDNGDRGDQRYDRDWR